MSARAVLLEIIAARSTVQTKGENLHLRKIPRRLALRLGLLRGTNCHRGSEAMDDEGHPEKGQDASEGGRRP